MAFLQNSTFETGMAGWRPINLAALVTSQVVRDGTARSGNSFLRVKGDQSSCSIGTDFELAVWRNYPDEFEFAATRSVGAIAYVRSAPGSPAISGQLKLWALGLESKPINSNGTNFTVGNEWTMIMCALDGTEYGYQSQKHAYTHPTIRLEFYITTPGQHLDIDTVFVS